MFPHTSMYAMPWLVGARKSCQIMCASTVRVMMVVVVCVVVVVVSMQPTSCSDPDGLDVLMRHELCPRSTLPVIKRRALVADDNAWTGSAVAIGHHSVRASCLFSLC